MSRKVVYIISVILILGTLCTVGIMYRTDPNEAAYTAMMYRNVTQDFERMTVTTSIEESEQEYPNYGYIPGNGNIGVMPGSSINQPNGQTNTSGGGNGPLTSLNYQPISERTYPSGVKLKYQQQTSSEDYWANVKGGDGPAATKGQGSTIRGEGCFIFALMSAAYNKYGVNPSPGNQMEDVIAEYATSNEGVDVNTLVNTSTGYLHIDMASKIGGCYSGCAVGSCNYPLPHFIMNKFGIQWDEQLATWPTAEGEYIVYFTYKKNNGNTGYHWIYCEVVQGVLYNGSGGTDPNNVHVTGILKVFKLK